jgi:hypothetical protein
MRSNRRHRQRGSLLIIVIVTMLVIAVMGLALMDGANATFQQGRRQPRLTSLQSLADAGAQYGYWKYTYGGVTLPWTNTNNTNGGPVTVGPGTFTVTVTDTSGTTNMSNTIQCVATATIGTDTYAVTKTYNKGSGGSSGPSAPTNLVATATTANIGLTWNAVTGASSYNIYRGTAAGAESATPLVSNQPGTSYTDSTAASGTTYYYYITAVSGGVESGHSNEASATRSSTGYVSATVSNTSPGNNYSNTEVVNITNTQAMTSLTVTVVVQKTAGLTYASAWNNFWSGYINQTYVDNGTTITYTATETAGNYQQAGTYNIDDQFSMTGTPHSTTADTYTIQVTAGGVSQTLTGHF